MLMKKVVRAFALQRTFSCCFSSAVSDDALVESLSRIVSSDNVLTDAQDVQPYNIDWKGIHGPGAVSKNRVGFHIVT